MTFSVYIMANGYTSGEVSLHFHICLPSQLERRVGVSEGVGGGGRGSQHLKENNLLIWE